MSSLLGHKAWPPLWSAAGLPEPGAARQLGLQPLLEWYRKHGLGPFCLIPPASLCFLEPGYYQDGEFGIRLEDVALVVEAKTKVKCCWDGLDLQTAWQGLWAPWCIRKDI